MYLFSLPTFFPDISSAAAIASTIILIILLITLEFAGHEHRSQPYISFLLYPMITLFGILVLMSVIQYVT